MNTDNSAEGRMEKNKTKIKRIISIIIVFILIGGILALIFSNRKASDFTEAEHLERVRQRIQKRFIDGDETIPWYTTQNADEVPIYKNATGVEVYPLYDVNDQFKYILIEYQPCGYTYVQIRDEWYQLTPFAISMYLFSRKPVEIAWTPCTVIGDNENDVEWETNENGTKIVYHDSPFSVRGVGKDEKRYIIEYNVPNGTARIPAVKRNGKYINLYSGAEFEMINGQPDKPQANPGSIFFIGKSYFNL